MKTPMFGRKSIVLLAMAAAVLSLAACNQPAQTASTAPVAALPPAPTPPPVPQYHRTADQEAQWQRYQALKAAYEEQVARAHQQGRQEQAAADVGRQAAAFDAGKHDQGQVDQAKQALAQAQQQAKNEPDPHRRDQIINQAKANLAAAQAH